MEIVHICTFAGYGAWHMGLIDAGFKITTTYFSEIDKYAIANLKYNFPDGIHLGDIKSVSGREIRERHPDSIIIVSFGWPCQDISIAGKRKGHGAGTRSGLLTEAIRIVDESKAWAFLAENVEGLRSINEGIDIVEILKLFSFLSESLPQYDVEMQLLNTLSFIAQNRSRCFFVGLAGATGGRKVLPITEADRLHNHENGGGKPRFVNCLDANYSKGWLDHGQRTHLIVNKYLELKNKEHASTLSGGAHSGGNHSDMDLIVDLNTASGKSKTRRGGLCKHCPTLDTNSNYAVIIHQRQGGVFKELDYAGTLTQKFGTQANTASYVKQKEKPVILQHSRDKQGG